jgi:hypothetical protein
MSHGAQPQAPVPSKVNSPVLDPTRPAIVAVVRLVPPRYDAAAHATAVADVHEVLLHCTDSSSENEGVWSFESKASPLMVTGKANPPVCAAFAELMLVKAGAAHARAKRLRMTAAFTRGDEAALLIRMGVDEEARQNPDRGLLHKPYGAENVGEQPGAGAKPHGANIHSIPKHQRANEWHRPLRSRV